MNPQIAGQFIAGRRVQVYFNLHRKTFSIRDAITKRVCKTQTTSCLTM